MMDRVAVIQTHKSGVEKYLKATSRERPPVRGLFLGTGESGKSTIFKQMRLVYGRDFDEFERMQYAKVIWGETLRAMRTLIDTAGAGARLCPDAATNMTLRQYANLMQGLDLSYAALMASETDARSREFLGSHLQSQQKCEKKNKRFRFMEVLDELYSDKIIDNSLIPDPLQLYPLRDLPKNFIPDRDTVGFAIHELWTKSPFLRQMATSGDVKTMPNASFFFERIRKFAQPGYMPDDEEILHARIKTTGIIASTFNLKGNQFEVVDVGGQRTERKKWIHCFDDATCVLFVVSVGDYFQSKIESQDQDPVNSLMEALQVFRETVSNQFLMNKPVALFLNKIDILEANLRLHPFHEYFPAYTGDPHNAQSICNFVENMFRKCVTLPSSSIYVYKTCATDRNAMKFVVEAVTNMIFIENLKWAGMM